MSMSQFNTKTHNIEELKHKFLNVFEETEVVCQKKLDEQGNGINAKHQIETQNIKEELNQEQSIREYLIPDD